MQSMESSNLPKPVSDDEIRKMLEEAANKQPIDDGSGSIIPPEVIIDNFKKDGKTWSETEETTDKPQAKNKKKKSK